MNYLSRANFLGFRLLFHSRASKKTRSHIIGAILGIGASLIPLIVVIQVSGGMIEGISRRFLEIGSYHVQLRSFTELEEEELNYAAETLKNHPRVKHVFPVIFGEGLLYSEAGKTGVSIRSLPADIYEEDEGLRRYLDIEEGAFRLDEANQAMLSRELADRLGVSIGDRVRLLTARPVPGRAPILRPSIFNVQGIFSTGYYELDSLSMYIPVDTGRVLFHESGGVVLGVKVERPFENIETLAAELRDSLPPFWQIYSWFNLERPMLESFYTTRNLLVFVMFLIVAVAAVNISSSMIMLVIEKEPEIAMLKSMGTSPRLIVLSFLHTGLFIGLAATIMGLALGLLAAVNINELIGALETAINMVYALVSRIIAPTAGGAEELSIFDQSYYLEEIPIRIRFVEIFYTALSSLSLSALAAYIPARKAGRIRPYEILRKH
ncbi:MAG TPA: ABC transporter permease [Sediminispirochaeta sp.]|nr:ABC transporter permease [Sediminispirochaeta sp.]